VGDIRTQKIRGPHWVPVTQIECLPARFPDRNALLIDWAALYRLSVRSRWHACGANRLQGSFLAGDDFLPHRVAFLHQANSGPRVQPAKHIPTGWTGKNIFHQWPRFDRQFYLL